MFYRTAASLSLLALIGTHPVVAQENKVPGDPIWHTDIGQHENRVREIGVATLKNLVEAAEKDGRRTVFIGGPMWAVGTPDHPAPPDSKPKPGIYLLDDNGFAEVVNQ